MKKTLITVAFVFICVAQVALKAQTTIDKKSATGSWMGKIPAGAIELRVVFNLTIIGKDSLVATLDSPDQGAKNIKLGPVSLSGSSIKISAGALLAKYNGTFKNDSLIEGTWKQGPKTMDLNLNRLKATFTLNRPQEPKEPFPYTSEDVTFTNKKFNIKLAGTLTIPKGNGPFPAVIMITGSGAQNRNEELMGHKPFMVIADYLSRNGIAVLRYDDRGVGKSQGNYASATSADLATDAAAAYNWLKSTSRINPKEIGLIGHSEGGLIAPIVASGEPGIAFIVSLAGPGVNGEQIIHRQAADISRASGVPEDQIKESVGINKKLFAVLKKEADNKIASEKMTTLYKSILEKKKATPEERAESLKQIQAQLSPASLTWFRYFIMTDPAKFWKSVKCPVLALNGSLDLQVAADVNLPAIEKNLKSSGNNSVKTMKMEGLNHLFQHCKSGLPAEYGKIDETFSPEVLKIIADWIVSL
jgi:alpha/beta superfamily hydrolase